MVPQWGVAGWQQAGVTRILTMLLFILIVINTLKVSTVSRRTQYSEKAPLHLTLEHLSAIILPHWRKVFRIFASKTALIQIL